MTKREFSSGGVVVKRWGRGVKVLLIKDSYGRWTWPKGHIEKGETSREAALREVREEVGLKSINILKKIGQTQYFYRLKGELIFKTVIIYLIEAGSKEKIRIQKSEIAAGLWFAPTQAYKKVDYKGAGSLLRKAVGEYRKMGSGK